MYAVIHDTYYRDTPERIQLSGMVSLKDDCRFMITADYKAGHAPDEAGDSRRPPMSATIVFSGEELKDLLLNKRYTEAVPLKPDDIRETLLKCAHVSTTGKRWDNLHLTIGEITRSSVMLVLRANVLSNEVMTLALPLGVLDELLSSTIYLEKNQRVRELVLTWPTVNYRNLLKATATTLG
ncbi:MAG: hypothetical protein GY833_12125 [Aestuariibacter sp.]|nr:hypothetical protein [Aestuariibacter sp.]|tara:strand:- start:15379 stop:15921 length:543 start_codon:yes stop_codon:yes gene_type:complete